MWHLYYKDNEIYSLSKKKQDLDLPYLRIADDLAEKFVNLEYRYIDWEVVKKNGRRQLSVKQNKMEPVWYKNFYQVPTGIEADIVVTKDKNIVSCTAPKTFWITEWNDPLRYLGKIHQSELLVPPNCKISIFAQKNKETIAYNDKDISC